MSISPNVPNPQESYHYENLGTPRWIPVLFGLLFAALGVITYAGHSVQTRLEQELSKADEQNKILTAQLEQANARLADIKGQVEVTSQKVGMTQAELADARSRAEAIRKQQAASDQKLSAQITEAQKERGKDWRGCNGCNGSEEGYRSDENRPGSDQVQAGSGYRRHGRNERPDCPQPRRPGRTKAQGRPQLL